jgi:hypothetical protein
MTKTPHKHAPFIKAWADGETIECYSRTHDIWFREFFPDWANWNTYRIRDAEQGICGEDFNPRELDLPGHR